MANEIYGGNLRQPYLYDFMDKDPDLQVFTFGHFNDVIGNKNNKDRTLYNASKDKYYANALAKNLKPNQYTSPFTFTENLAIGEIDANKNAWYTLNTIFKEQKGHIIAFDTETIGNFQPGHGIESEMAGITEISFATKSYGRSRIKEDPLGSFVFGIDSKQRQWLQDVLEKKKNGEILTPSEASSMERLSRYSSINHDGYAFSFHKQVFGFNNQEYNVVNRLNLSNPDSIADIESGLENLTALYNPNREEQISGVVDFFNKKSKSKNVVFTGHNLSYDLNAIEQYSNLHGTSKLKDIEYVDTLKALRSYADMNNVTIAEIMRQINPNVYANQYGKLETIMDVIGDSEYASKAAHNAYEDSLATIKVLENKNLNIIDKALDVLDQVNSSPNEVSLQDALVKINKKANIRPNDFVVIDGVVTNSYQASNQFWNFKGIGNTYFDALTVNVNNQERVLKDSANKVVAYFENPEDSKIGLFKTFNTKDEMADWFRANTSIVNREQADIPLQTRIRNKDIARRTIDGFFQPTRTNETLGGFADFQKYYNFYKDIASLSEESVQSMSLFGANGSRLKTAQELISNISYSDNLEKVVSYFESNGIHSSDPLFRFNANANLPLHDAMVKTYDTRFRVEGAFEAFSLNKGFFDFAESNISQFGKTNIQNTVAFEALRNLYLKSEGVLNVPINKEFNIDDINSVSLLIDNEYVNLDVSDIKRGTSRLNSLIAYNKNNIEASIDLINIAKDLHKQGIFRTIDLESILTTHSDTNNPYTIAESIVTKLNSLTESVRKYTPEEYAEIYARVANKSLENIDNINERIVFNKQKTLLESATNLMTTTIGDISEDFTEGSKPILDTLRSSFIVSGSLDESNPAERNAIMSRLSKLNYDDASINGFMKIFYKNPRPNVKANIELLNSGIEDANKVVPIFFATKGETTADYLVLTRQKDYGRALSVLSGLNDDVSQKEVKESLKGIASYLEIPYLDVLDLSSDETKESDDIIRKLTSFTDSKGTVHQGHGARSVIVKQGDSYARYDPMSLNIYTDSEGKITGNIRDAGGDYVTSIRQRYTSSHDLISKGSYDEASRSLNGPNISKMAEDSAPQFSGLLDIHGNVIRDHMFTQKDIDYAYMINLDPESSTGLKGFMQELITDEAMSISKNTGNTGLNTLSALYDLFDETYDLSIKNKDGSRTRDLRNVQRVFGSEQFNQFFERNLTGQSGGINKEEFIREYMETHPDSYITQSLRASEGKGIMQIIADASQNNAHVTQQLADVLHTLAYESGMDSVGSESMTHHNVVFIGNHSIAENTNSRHSGIYRPTYAQQSNYRPFTLEGQYFTNPEELSSKFGMHFGDVYAPENFIERKNRGDIKRLGQENFNRNTASYRNIVGAVQSISDAELVAGKEEGLQFLLKNNSGLDRDALAKVYNRMYQDINTYEGKFYIRPEIANQNFMLIGDPKTVSIPDLEYISKYGSEVEREATLSTLNDLVGKNVGNGTVIGRKLNNNNKFVPIFYNGPEISNFSIQDAEDLYRNGKTVVNVSRQLDDVKLFIGHEKGTAESLLYFSSLDKREQQKEIAQLMESLGLEEYTTDSLEDNIRELNKYTNAAYDAISRTNQSAHKTIAIFNNNIVKHLTDMSFESKWSLLGLYFNGQEGLEDLQFIADDISNNQKLIAFSDGSSYSSHIKYDAINDTLTFDNPIDKGSVNVLDDLIGKIRESDMPRARAFIEQLDIIEKNGKIAIAPIQRQFMTTFQADKFKMDSRIYQSISMQAEGDYTRGEGAKLAEFIRKSISEGLYDEHIVSIGDPNAPMNKTWSDIVRSRRGILRPKQEQEMVSGIIESIKYLNDSYDITNKNIVKLDAREILQNIPTESNWESYQKFIFKIDDNFSPYIKSRSKLNGNNVNLDATSNTLFIDLSSFGNIKYNDKDINGILIPYQQIQSGSKDKLFIAESSKATVSFFNKLKSISTSGDDEKITSKKISEAINDLFQAYAKELDDQDKNSLISKTAFKLTMPNSAQVLGKDAVVPVIDVDIDTLNKINDLESSIIHKMETDGSIDDALIKELQSNYSKISTKTKDKLSSILETNNVIDNIRLTANNKYINFIKHYDQYGNVVKNTIESAMMVGESAFGRTEMDLGRIGSTLFFTPDSLNRFDNISRKTEKIFELNERHGELNKFLNEFFKSFDNTDYESWARQTKYALLDIMQVRGDEALQNASVRNEVVSELYKQINKGISETSAMADTDMASDLLSSYNKQLTKQEQQKFLTEINKRFEGIGKRYASEVGILGLTTRYPVKSEREVLPVRIYLDETIKGNSVRYLGPQFSVMQNLDFDGDTEFIKFLGNAGLYSKAQAGKVTEYSLLEHQFDLLNKKNFDVFIQNLTGKEPSSTIIELADTYRNSNGAAKKEALKNLREEISKLDINISKIDSLKSYRIGDSEFFKAALLGDIQKENYEKIVEQFKDSLSKKERDAFDSYDKNIQELLISHSPQMKKSFRSFDETLGSAITNPEMVKAAMQARVAKEYIGNFSKPNLNIRDTMTYMFSMAKDQAQIDKLKELRENIFPYLVTDGDFPSLDYLEQQGIDTKHVHDATYFNSSTSWRLGVKQLFENANGAPNIDIKQREQALELLISGSRKVLEKEDKIWGEDEKALSNGQIAKRILSKPFDELNQQEKFLKSIYELSLMDNAYQGYAGNFKRFSLRKATENIQLLNDEYIQEVLRQSESLNNSGIAQSIDQLASSIIYKTYQENVTDDILLYNNRALKLNDIVLYQHSYGPKAFVYKGMQNTNEGFTATFKEFDLKTLKELPYSIDGDIQASGISIRDLNEAIKRDPRNTKLKENLYGNRQLDFYNEKLQRNFNLYDLGDPANKAEMQKMASELSLADKIQTLFENRSNRQTYDIITSSSTSAVSSSENVGQYIKSLVGDYDTFLKNADSIEEYLQYGIETRAITRASGSLDAKSLIRHINRQIAKNPTDTTNFSRFLGDSPLDLITNYLRDIDGIRIVNTKFLMSDISNIRLSNEINKNVSDIVSVRHSSLTELADEFYELYANGTNEDLLKSSFETISNKAQQINAQASKDIFGNISRSNDQYKQLFETFNWSDFTRDDNFIINSVDDTIKTKLLKAKVGYGQFIGVEFSDLTKAQKDYILDVELKNISNLAENSLEYSAAQNTRTLLNYYRATSLTSDIPDFSSMDALINSTRIRHEENEEVIKNIQKQINEALVNSSEKRTLKNGIKETIQNSGLKFNISKPALKIGGAVLGTTAALGIIGHALFNNNDKSNVEVPKEISRSFTESDSNMRPSNKMGTEYSNAPTEAKQVQKTQRKVPTPKRTRTIYHDANSGFNFKVSAQSYNKLSEESYQRMAQMSGSNNATLNVNKDNSRITDNWLQNKFASLME